MWEVHLLSTYASSSIPSQTIPPPLPSLPIAHAFSPITAAEGLMRQRYMHEAIRGAWRESWKNDKFGLNPERWVEKRRVPNNTRRRTHSCHMQHCNCFEVAQRTGTTSRLCHCFIYFYCIHRTLYSESGSNSDSYLGWKFRAKSNRNYKYKNSIRR